MRGRSFLKELDFSGDELRSLIDLAAELKADAKSGHEKQRMKGKKIALIFEKTSTRTRCAFEVAAYDQGAHVTYLGPDSSQIGQKESIKDTARVLGRMFDAIEYRGFGQDVVEQLAEFAGVPVYNGLSNEFHPTQMLADVLTMREHSEKPLNSIAFCYIGDARFNTGNAPGSPRHTGHVFMFGGSPNFVEQEQKSFEFVSSWAWHSSPITAS